MVLRNRKQRPCFEFDWNEMLPSLISEDETVKNRRDLVVRFDSSDGFLNLDFSKQASHSPFSQEPDNLCRGSMFLFI